MMDPLLDERDRELEVALLRAGKDVEWSSASQTKLLVALGVSTSLAAGTQSAAAAGLLGKLTAGKAPLVASLAAAGAVGAGVYYVADSSGFDEERPAIAVQATQRAPVIRDTQAHLREVEKARAEAERRAIQEKPTAATEMTQVERQPLPPDAPKASKPRSATKSNDGTTLGEELALVESASRATNAGNTSLALERLAEYQRRFPRGKLALEAQVIRIEALARQGRQAEAKRLARAFLKRHPKSPIGARIARYAE